jgi:hypothetical protein
MNLNRPRRVALKVLLMIIIVVILVILIVVIIIEIIIVIIIIIRIIQITIIMHPEFLVILQVLVINLTFHSLTMQCTQHVPSAV